jgi:hypothetical protein
VALGLVLASPSAALEVTLDPPRKANGYLMTDIRLDDVFSPRVEGSLSRGMPATFQFHAELWRRRTAWFDRMESSFDASVKLRYDVWSKLYRLEQKGRPPMAAPTLDSVGAILSRPLGLPVAKAELLRPGARYYLAVSVTLKPLTVEDIEEGEGWLSGEVETKRSAGLGIVTAIPRAVFDAVRNFAGFGDQRARAISDDFEEESLAPAR